jgi:hypothetical protein
MTNFTDLKSVHASESIYFEIHNRAAAECVFTQFLHSIFSPQPHPSFTLCFFQKRISSVDLVESSVSQIERHSRAGLELRDMLFVGPRELALDEERAHGYLPKLTSWNTIHRESQQHHSLLFRFALNSPSIFSRRL